MAANAAPAAETPAATPLLPTPTPAVAGTGTPAFDAIMMLQNLAATAATLDAADFEAADTADLIGGDDSSDDEDAGEELEASLAFLSELLTATVPQNPARQFDTGGEPRRETPEEPMPAAANARNSVPDFTETAMAMLLNEASAETDNALFTSMPPEPVEPGRHGTDATQNLVRAAEMLSSVRTGAVASIDRPMIGTPVRDPRWADEFASRVSLMVRGGESTASLQLTPVDLGPVEINVTVKETQATVHFGASQAETRALIEASLPRLRELLESQGYQLTDASVSSGFRHSQRNDAPSGGAGASEVEPVSTEVRSVRDLGVLDVYA